MILKILRYFGHTISNLHLHSFRHLLKFSKTFEMYLAEYCHESLEQLSAHGIKLLDINKQFLNVQVVNAKFSDLLELPFNRNFPNLKSVKLKRICFQKFETQLIITHHFPKLTRLSFDGCKYDIHCFQKDEVIDLLKINPQLEELQLVDDENEMHKPYMYHETFQCINEYLPLLRKFSLIIGKRTLKNIQEPIYFDNILDFHVIFFTSHDIPNIPFQFKNLKSFTATGGEMRDRYGNMNNFIIKHKNLLSLGFIYKYIDHSYVERISSRHLNNIEKLRINGYYMDWNNDFEQFLCFLKNNHKLNHLYLKGIYRGFYRDMYTVLRSGRGIKLQEKIINKYTHIILLTVFDSDFMSFKGYILKANKSFMFGKEEEYIYIECHNIDEHTVF